MPMVDRAGAAPQPQAVGAEGALPWRPAPLPWYAVWLLPLRAVTPSLPWIAFSGTLVLAYSFFLNEPWDLPWWARTLELAPLAVAAAGCFARRLPIVAASARAPWLSFRSR